MGLGVLQNIYINWNIYIPFFAGPKIIKFLPVIKEETSALTNKPSPTNLEFPLWSVNERKQAGEVGS